MKEALKNLLARLRAWMAQNGRDHRSAEAGPCCSAPSRVYAARHSTDGKSRHE